MDILDEKEDNTSKKQKAQKQGSIKYFVFGINLAKQC